MRQYSVNVNGKEYPVNLISRRGEVVEFEINGKNYSTSVAPIFSFMNANAPAAAGVASHSSISSNEIKAPMPGIIVSIGKKEGDTVQAGESLLVIEAMKMENNLTAPKNGVVKTIHIKVGQEVENHQLLISLE